MESFEDWLYVIIFRDTGHYPGCFILQGLKSINLSIRNAAEQRVAVVQSGGYKRMNQLGGRCVGKNVANRTNVPDVEIYGSTYVGNLILHGKMSIKNDTQVAGVTCRVDSAISN